MLAIRVHSFGGPEVLRLDTVPALPAPGPTQVLVRLSAAGVNPVDTYIRAGNYGPREFPFTPGMDGAGVVEALGAEVAARRPDLAPGARVWVCRSVTGTYAQFALCEMHQVRPLPARLSFEQGAGVGVASLTAWSALFQRGRARAGETVLVRGASGGVGQAAVTLAKAAGLRVVATAGTPEGRALVEQLGADVVVDHRAPDCEQRLLDAAAKLDSRAPRPANIPAGPDVVIEVLANVNLAKDLALVGFRGRIVVVGNRGEITLNPRAAMARDASVLGMSLMNLQPAEWEEACAAVGAALASGVLTPRVAQVFDLADAPRAHERVMDPAGALGKLVLRIPAERER
ncbi:MAG: NADPH:quinone reductase [Planctomycetota bacterium]|nr:NADPH:quinone reductase [Planctomycetota bacterium]